MGIQFIKLHVAPVTHVNTPIIIPVTSLVWMKKRDNDRIVFKVNSGSSENYQISYQIKGSNYEKRDGEYDSIVESFKNEGTNVLDLTQKFDGWKIETNIPEF